MKVIIFGASGTAGGSVLKSCLSSPIVEEVRAITRRSLPISNDKLSVFLHKDFLDYALVSEAFTDVEACFYCLGVSTTQVSGEQEYRRITHDFALAAAQMLKIKSPNAVFHFISGQGTRFDSRFMWARVKAETENDLMSLTKAVCFRPAFIDGELSVSSPRLYRVLLPLARLLKPFRSLYVAGEDIGRAMLQARAENIRNRVIENAEIRVIADRSR
jgi:uncharacterized protein YbjT (DUF2867 family)